MLSLSVIKQKKNSKRMECVSSKKRLIKMSLDKSKILELSDSSRKFIPKKQRPSLKDPTVERTEWFWNKKENKVSGGMVGIIRQKASDERGPMLEVEIHPHPALNENHAERRMEEKGNRRLTSESTPVEQGHDAWGDRESGIVLFVLGTDH